MYAAWRGHRVIVEYLHQAGADINIRNKWNSSALDLAAVGKRYPVCQYFVQAGADCSNAPGDLLCLATDQGDLAMVQQIVTAGADINKTNRKGLTPVNVAAKQGHHHLCEYFMNLGADLNIADRNGLTPLYFICQAGNNDLVKKMLDYGADVNSSGCLQVALDNYNNDVAETLIELGCDVNKVRYI